jgi:hemolysin III
MSKTTQHHQCSRNEEIANSLTHGFGTLMSIAGLVVMVVLAVYHGDGWQIVSFSIFGSTLILLYLASTLYHSISHPTVKKFLKVFDHSAIYLLIAGTYTPFVLVTLRGVWGWSIFGVIWGLAIAGILLKCVFVGRFHNLSIAIYIFMGWFCLVASKQLIANLMPFSLILLIFGGLSYTLGVIFYSWRKLPFNHAIWHLFVLAGSAFHYFSVLSTL